MSLLKIHSFAAVSATKLKCLMEHQIALLLHTQECMSHFPLAMADANKIAAVYIHEACVTCDSDLMRGYMELQEEYAFGFLLFRNALL